MSNLLIDPRTAGIAGDMLFSAILSLTSEKKICKKLTQAINSLTKTTVNIDVEETKTKGIDALKLNINIDGDRYKHPSNLISAYTLVAQEIGLSEYATAKGLQVINILCEAEKKVHKDHFHLHEVGSVDTIIDIVGSLYLLEKYNYLKSDILCLPIATGNGFIKMDHGIIPSPAPATLEILCSHKIPVITSDENYELATPTGVAMMAALATKFISSVPTMVPLKTGYGAGNAVLENSPNITRVMKIEPVSNNLSQVTKLETTVDDISGEILGNTIDMLLQAGALDAIICPATGKKNRPTSLISVLCKPQDVEKISELLMVLTGTLGVRIINCDRLIAKREIESREVEIEGNLYNFRIKISKYNDQIINIKPEFDDICSIAKKANLSVRQVTSKINKWISII